MLEASWLIESAVIATPMAGAAALRWREHARLRALLHEPLCWEAGLPISLAGLFSELNGEANLLGELTERFGVAGPLGVAELGPIVARLRTEPTLRRQLMLSLAIEAAVKEHPPTADAALALVGRLESAYAEKGVFGLIATASEARGAGPLAPMAGVLPGGLPLAPEAGPPWPSLPATGHGLLSALTGAQRGPWLPQVAQAVEGMFRHWHVRKAREAFERELGALGNELSEVLKQHSAVGIQLRFNVYAPQDAYLNVEARARTRLAELSGGRWLSTSAERLLYQALAHDADKTWAMVSAKCDALLRLLIGKQGPLAAGEALYFHRSALLKGIAPEAFRIKPVEAAEAAYRQALAQPEETSESS